MTTTLVRCKQKVYNAAVILYDVENLQQMTNRLGAATIL